MTVKSYTVTVFVLTALLLVGVLGLTLTVDPYGVHDAAPVAGFNQRKPETDTHVRLYKDRALDRAAPVTVLLGNSRVDAGFDPASDTWPADMRPVFNAGIPGTATEYSLRVLRRALRLSTVKTVIVGLDVLDFRVDPAETDATAPPPADWEVGDGGPLTRARRFMETSLSLKAVIDSLLTIAAQGNPHAAHRAPTGYNTMAEYGGFVALEGHHAIFLQRNLENFANYRRGPKAVARADGTDSAEWRAVKDIIALAGEKGVNLVFVLFPYHADVLEGFRLAGLDPAFEDFKRRLTALAAASGRDIPVWDFSGHSALTDEPVPPPGDTRTHMAGYWEAGHFKAALGDAMVKVMTGAPGARPGILAGFGVRLTPATLEAHLADLRARRQAYAQAHPEAVDRAERQFARTAR